MRSGGRVIAAERNFRSGDTDGHLRVRSRAFGHAIALLLIGATIRNWFRSPRSYERSAIDEAGRDLATAN